MQQTTRGRCKGIFIDEIFAFYILTRVQVWSLIICLASCCQIDSFIAHQHMGRWSFGWIMMGVPSLRRGVVLDQLLTLIGKRVSKYCRMLGAFKKPLDFISMGTVSGEMEFPTYLTRVLDLAFIVSSGVLISWIILLLFGFPLVFLFVGGWWGLNCIHLLGLSRIFSFRPSRIRSKGLSWWFRFRLVFDRSN